MFFHVFPKDHGENGKCLNVMILEGSAVWERARTLIERRV